jgi:hypothetical protein
MATCLSHDTAFVNYNDVKKCNCVNKVDTVSVKGTSRVIQLSNDCLTRWVSTAAFTALYDGWTVLTDVSVFYSVAAGEFRIFRANLITLHNYTIIQ